LAQQQRLVVAPEQLAAERLQLTREQQHYLYRVLRLQSGDRFVATDGCGRSWQVQLEDFAAARLVATAAAARELAWDVMLLAALPKGSAFDGVVRCATELGVSTIVPVTSDRALLQPGANKLRRWCRIAQEAAEQAERAVVPTVGEPVPFGQALQVPDAGRARYLAAARAGAPPLLACLPPTEASAIAIATGPEGGWSESELEAATAAGFQTVSLGDRILRAATAPIAAMAIATAAADTAAGERNG